MIVSMWSDLAIVSNDILCNMALCMFKCTIADIWYPFRFQASEEALHRAIIPTVPSSTHTLYYLIAS
jgi:hypothetical protein